MGSIAAEPQYGDVQTTLGHFLEESQGGFGTYVAGTIAQYRKKSNHVPVLIHDTRKADEEISLEQQGFTIVPYEGAERDFDDEERIKSAYYSEVQDVVKKATCSLNEFDHRTGATKVYAFSHLLRRARPEQALALAADPTRSDDENTGIMVPSTGVHIDQSEAGARSILRDNMTAEEVSKLEKTRWAIMNLWKPIKTIRRNPLAVCDSRTVQDKDLVASTVLLPKKGTGTFDNVSKGGSFEILQLHNKPEHRWYYTSLMRPEEALILKIYDTKRNGDKGRRVPHGSFHIPGTEDEPTRESVETRCLVFWEDQPAE